MVQSNRDFLSQQIYDTLTKLNTPQQIIDTIKHGSYHWTAESDPDRLRALTRGSVMLGDVNLTVVFTEQYHSIGWHQLYLGRVSAS